MAITVENGSIVSGANSYVTEAELTAYATARGVTLTTGTEQLLIQAMDYLEGKNFIGDKNNIDQPLQWPRLNVLVDGFFISSDAIPQSLKDGQMEIAISLDAGDEPLASQGRETRREKIGEIEIEYAPTARAMVYLTAAENKLRKLINKSLTATVVRA